MTNQPLQSGSTLLLNLAAVRSADPIEDGMVKFRRLELLRDVGIYFIRKDLKWVRRT